MRRGGRGRIALVGLTLLLVAWPAEAAPKLGAGVLTNGTYSVCNAGTPDARLSFDFAGRMPAGSTVYTVTAGRAAGTWDCLTSTSVPLAMRGQTPSGSFRWNCAGRIWLELSVGGGPPIFSYEGRCKTEGRPGQFRLALVFQTLQDRDPSIGHERWTFAGAYVAGTG
jgi:hypothetical protein